MATILITGANRGLGLEFTRQYAAAGHTVIGTVRTGADKAELEATGADIMTLDVADRASIANFAKRLGDRTIDLFINNAGVMGPRQFDREGWAETLAVNSIAPVELAIQLKDNLAGGARKTMVALSSELGSIDRNQSGGLIAYRSSKAALNAAWKSLSVDWSEDGYTMVVVHPGWVQTDMGGKNATLTPEESIAGLIDVIEGLTPRDNGKFLNWDGEELPW